MPTTIKREKEKEAVEEEEEDLKRRHGGSLNVIMVTAGIDLI